jgi:hypothetical protein
VLVESPWLYIGAGFEVIVLLVFAVQVGRRKIPPTSSASWVMWLAMDSLILAATLAAEKPPWLALSYVVGATIVTVVLFFVGKWTWTFRDTFCAVCMTIATIVWQTTSAEYGVFAEVSAMVISGIPILLNMLRAPARKTFLVWFGTACACVLTLFGSDGTLAGIVLPWGSLIYNGFMALVVLRRPRERPEAHTAPDVEVGYSPFGEESAEDYGPFEYVKKFGVVSPRVGQSD